MPVEISGPSVQYTDNAISSEYVYHSTNVTKEDDTVKVSPIDKKIHFKTQRQPKKTGVMLVGWGGNNGTTVTAGILSNKHDLSWRTKKGIQKPNYFGSITQASTVRMGITSDMQEIHVPLNTIIPMVNPNDLVVGGWDCSSMPIGDAMKRSQVLEVELQDKVYPYVKDLKPLPAIFDLDFVAENQEERADNVIKGSKKEAVEVTRGHIRNFKKENDLENVIVLWTANTERWCLVTEGVHDTADNLLKSLESNSAEIAPSTCYGVAAVLEGCSYINGAPQNSLVPGLIELAKRNKAFVGGDDFKSGQTKMKSAVIEFFVSAGIKPECIASYNHLGNNDGKNLAAPKQFRSKEITKSNVVDDMVASNDVLYPPGASHKPDHCIVIKHLPYVGDSKRAIDEYSFSIFMGGEQTVVMHNTCQDSLLASPLIIDLVIMTELWQRVEFKEEGGEYHSMDTVLSLLSYLLKAPVVTAGTPVINALNRQKQAIENTLRALVGLPAENGMMLECRGL